MTRLQNTFEGHATSGIAITTGNSGGASGDAFDATSVGAGSFLESAATGVVDGIRSMRINAAAAEVAYASWLTSMGTKTEIWGRAYVALLALPTGSARMFTALNATTRGASLQIGTTGKIALVDAGNTVQATTTAALNVGGISRVEWHMVFNATTGLIEVKLFLTDPAGASPDETKTTAATLATGAQATAYRFGRAESGAAATGDYWMDAIAIDDTAYIGAYSPGDVLPLPIRQNQVVLRDSFR